MRFIQEFDNLFLSPESWIDFNVMSLYIHYNYSSSFENIQEFQDLLHKIRTIKSP